MHYFKKKKKKKLNVIKCILCVKDDVILTFDSVHPGVTLGDIMSQNVVIMANVGH